MVVNVIGPNGGVVQPDLHGMVVMAVRNYAQQLGISRLKNHILVRVHHKTFLDDQGTQGLCEPLSNRNFIIDVCMYTNWLVNLAHEMVHVRQFSKGELDLGMVQWKSLRVSENMDYWVQPWEKEARRLQYKLAEEFDKTC